MESSSDGAQFDEEISLQGQGNVVKSIGGLTDIEGILLQQLKVLQSMMNDTQRAHSLASGRNRLLRKAQGDLAELQVENMTLKKQLENNGLVPEVKMEKGDGAQPIQAWYDNNDQPLPGAVEESGSNVGADKKLMPMKLAPLLPVEKDSTQKVTATEIKDAESKLSEEIQKASNTLQMPPSSMPVVDKKTAEPASNNGADFGTSSLNPSAPRKSRERASGRMEHVGKKSTDESKDTKEGDHEHVCEKTKAADSGAPKAVFADAAALKEKLRMDMAKPPYDVKNFYKTTGFAQKVARSHVFDNATLAVIGFNALWIMVDTDYNNADVLLDAEPIFIIMENFFCTYFFGEWLFRYLSFKMKRNCLKDAWFVFDSALVFLMVGETWIMTAIIAVLGGAGGGLLGNASILRLVRLLRLSRMARMARLLRAMPELMVLIKGMAVAMRSVFFTLVLLAGIIYIFGIALVQLLKDTEVGDELFKTVPGAMDTLLLQGILPDEAALVDECEKAGALYKAIALVYILLAGLTVMNMLVGVLCEVVSVVSSVEKESLLVNYVKGTLQHMLTTSGIDTDGDQLIAKNEFGRLLQFEGAAKAIQEVGVDVVGLMDFTDFIFKDGKALSFPEFMDMILQLRGTNTATVKDIVDLRRYVTVELDMMDQRICDTLSQEITQILLSVQQHGITGAPTIVTNTNNDNDPSMAWAASAASRLCVAAGELSVAATELGCRQRVRRRNNLEIPAITDG